MTAFLNFLEKRLQKPLPGNEAQKKMIPEPMSDQALRRRMEPPSDAVASGVMLLLIPEAEDSFSLVFTLRSDEIEQGGQICFPGGRAESVESPAEAALRETEEEIGVAQDSIYQLGALTSLYVTTSNSLIHPVVGSVSEKPDFQKDPFEVQEIFTASLTTLNGPNNLNSEIWTLNGNKYEVPYWNIHRVPLWGATAMILSEFMELYREFNNR